jgi:hypothetical protein
MGMTFGALVWTASESLMPARVERRWGTVSASEPARAGNLKAIVGLLP